MSFFRNKAICWLWLTLALLLAVGQPFRKVQSAGGFIPKAQEAWQLVFHDEFNGNRTIRLPSVERERRTGYPGSIGRGGRYCATKSFYSGGAVDKSNNRIGCPEPCPPVKLHLEIRAR